MRRWVGAAWLLAGLVLGGQARADESDEPWEPEPAVVEATPVVEPPAFAPLREVASGAIGFYQRRIGPNSVSRCQYAVSCSRFAAGEIERHGLLVGLLYFLDRFYFREHTSALAQHRDDVVRTPDGRLTIDDGAFRLP